jgi:hypothetical protein
MRRILAALVTLATIVGSAPAQKIETQKPDQDRIIHVQTSLNHLTVIEVGGPVTMVAAGSQAFKVEWRENKVFVQPTEPNAATNLFIWTASGRFNYELDPAGSVTGMDFAIDQPASGPPASKPATATPPRVQEPAPDAVLGGQPVRMDRFKEPKNRVIVLLKDTFRQDNELLVRYAVVNNSKETYDAGRPRVFRLVAQDSQRLYRRANSQLTDDEAEGLDGREEHPVEVLDTRLRSARVEPGQETVGVVGLNLPAARAGGPTVLRLTFPDDGKGPITATLVL